MSPPLGYSISERLYLGIVMMTPVIYPTSAALRDEKDIVEEEEIFAEMMRVIEKRDQLVTRIEEQRLRENSEEKNLLDFPLPKDYQLKMTTINKGRLI